MTNPKAVFKGKNYRISIISDMILRLEYDEEGVFNDYLTENIQNRNFPLPHLDVQEDHATLIVNTKYFRLQYLKEKPFKGSLFAPDSTLRVNVLNSQAYWYYGSDEAKNVACLKPNLDLKKEFIFASEALDAQENKDDKTKETDEKKKQKAAKKAKDSYKKAKNNIFERQKSLYSLDGFSTIDDSNSMIIDDKGYMVPRTHKSIDMYVFVYNKDFRLFLGEYATLAGRCPLIPRYALGIWWYKDDIYTFDNVRKLVYDFNSHHLPLNVLVMGSNWHIKDPNDLKKFKNGFTFNRDKLGTLSNFTTFLHERGIRLGLSLDPTEGIHPHEFKYRDYASELGVNDSQDLPFNVLDKNVVAAYLDKLITPLYNENVDFFFLDVRTKDKRVMDALNYYHYNDYKKFTNYRGMILARPALLGALRYPILYTGETEVSWDTLRKLPEFISSSYNSGLTWWSNDIGGFKGGIEDSELYLRYVEFGTFSPIFRFASSYGHYYKREPWRWNNQVLRVVKDYLNLRIQLSSYLYAEGYKYYKLGIPIFMPLYHVVPAMIDEPDYKNEYFFGSELLVSPITTKKDIAMQRSVEKIYLPNGTWYDFKTGKRFNGNTRYVMFFNDEDYPVFAKKGSIVPMYVPDKNINNIGMAKNLEVHIFPGESNIYNLYEDDGVSSLYEQGYYIVTRFDYNYLQNNYTLIIRPYEGKSGIIPDTRNYKIRFRNTRTATDVRVLQEADKKDFTAYSEDSDFVIEINDVSTVKQLTIICRGKDIEIDATRILNEDIDSIISDIPVETVLKNEIAKIMFSEKDYSDKRIMVKKLRAKGLSDLYIRMLLRLLEYTSNKNSNAKNMSSSAPYNGGVNRGPNNPLGTMNNNIKG